MSAEIYTAYAQNNDMTFIMKDVCDDTGEVVSTECVGWYWGTPNDASTEEFSGKLKAKY